MQMTESEIKTNIMQAKDQIAQIPICAQLNGVSIEKVKDILRKQGVDLRTLKGPAARKGWKVVPVEQDPEPAPAQREAINAELLTIKAELIKMVSAIDGGHGDEQV